MNGVTLLRLILFLGLAFHKLLWELMKRRDEAGNRSRELAGNPAMRVVKVCKLLALVFLITQTLFLDLFRIVRRPTLLRVLGTAVYFLGLVISVSGRLQLGKNWANLEDYDVLQGQSIATTGIYRYMRHPIYVGDALLLLGLQLALNSWLVFGVAVPLAVIARQAAKEEAILSTAFPEYREYRERTKRFIPFLI